MLRYALSVCKEKGMGKVVLGCYKDNLASAATIRKNGGILTVENNNDKENKTSQYYSITLSESTAASAEYENINDNGSAKTKRNAQIMAEDIRPNLIP